MIEANPRRCLPLHELLAEYSPGLIDSRRADAGAAALAADGATQSRTGAKATAHSDGNGHAHVSLAL